MIPHSPRWPPHPEDVRLLVAGDRLVPVECRYVGMSCGMFVWAVITPQGLERDAVRGMTAKVVPPKVAVMFDFDLGPGERPQLDG